MKYGCAAMIGLVVGVVVSLQLIISQMILKSLKNVAKASKSGPAFTILSGVSYGLLVFCHL